ncbi:MAG: TetR/AcrR family transcriptional regulator C-terminal domain-containing protein [Candidatus Cloacimonetes bacterium]|nr:TetR/AcrR family transcriptional regulator C-terminal domain-containing protein [Candidatus Cloacimonadota bacterium]
MTPASIFSSLIKGTTVMSLRVSSSSPPTTSSINRLVVLAVRMFMAAPLSTSAMPL